MNIAITSEILQAYYLCPRKAYLLIHSKEKGDLHEYEKILESYRFKNYTRNLELIKQKYCDIYPYNIENFREEHEFLIDANLSTKKFQAHCPILIRTDNQIYEPTIFIGTYKIYNIDKLKLTFISHVLAEIQDKSSRTGCIINVKGESRRLKLESSYKILTPLLSSLQEWLNRSSIEEVPVILNKNCPICQFRKNCREIAIQEDNLSLLNKVTPKVLRQYEKKGIFTVKQLSYLFKPRKRKKRARHPPAITHDIKLQALAIRTKKIYLQEIPNLLRKETELYLDIEGLPDQNLYYLIGLLVYQGDKSEYHSFWADNLDDEEKIWKAFLAVFTQYTNAPIYHYGSYELRAIKALDKRYKTDSKLLISHLNNINKQVYGKLYFPVYSNKLKEVAKFVGADWTAPNASGIQSLVWRHYWNDSQDSQYKSKLITYNKEDCYALKFLVDEIERIQHSADVLSDVDFAHTPKSQVSSVGEKVSSQFEVILKFASVKYDDKKISFSEGKLLEECKRGGANPSKVVPKPNKIVQVPQSKRCLKCNYKPLKLLDSTIDRTIIDLVVGKSGIKKFITKYIGFYVYCPKCYRKYSPPKIMEFSNRQFYGHKFKSWIVYLRVSLRLPFESILELAKEQFNEEMSSTRITYFIKNFAEYYSETAQSIVGQLLKSPFIHVDETDFNIRGVNWYVWVFTNGQYVLFKLTETREADIAHEVLKGYEGILISDFYTGYDSIPCRQQKCWVHLIRHLNKDLRENPFDMEYEIFISEVRSLIVPIMEAVQKYGLKKYHLKKFQKEVYEFYGKAIESKQYRSELASRYQQHFRKYKKSLFTFLTQDGIPWHNNTAENALRHVAIQRDISKTSFHEEPTRNYLVLLGIRQTCRYQNKSFFKFLFSGETDLNRFKPKKKKRNKK